MSKTSKNDGNQVLIDGWGDAALNLGKKEEIGETEVEIPVYRLHSQTLDKEIEPKVDQGEEIEETEVDIETIENNVEKRKK